MRSRRRTIKWHQADKEESGADEPSQGNGQPKMNLQLAQAILSGIRNYDYM